MSKKSLGLVERHRNLDDEGRKNLRDGLPYKVGKLKPPTEHQFKPGNKMGKGRPKGSMNIASIMEEELSAKVAVNEKGRTVKVSMARVLVRQITRKGAQGDLKAALAALELGRKNGVLSAPAQETAAPMFSPDDVETLKSFEAILALSHPAHKPGEDDE